MDKKNLVYMVWYDNNEPYEDKLLFPERIFKTWEEAENYIEENYSISTKKSMVKRIRPAYRSSCYIIKRPEWDEIGQIDHGIYCIRIWNVFDGREVPYDNEHIFLVEN